LFYVKLAVFSIFVKLQLGWLCFPGLSLLVKEAATPTLKASKVYPRYGKDSPALLKNYCILQTMSHAALCRDVTISGKVGWLSALILKRLNYSSVGLVFQDNERLSDDNSSRKTDSDSNPVSN